VTRRTQLVLWITLPVFFAVFVVVRTLWLAYLKTLSLAELHMRIFAHPAAVAVGVSATCVLLTWLIVWVLSKRLTRPNLDHDSPAV
jgi:cell division protein FtsX